jgi:hypothetical protein
MKTLFRRLAVAAAVACLLPAASAGVFTIAGVTFNTDNSIRTAAIVEGNVIIADHSSKLFARIEAELVLSQSDDVNEFLIFDRGKSIGRILGRNARNVDDRARFVSFPERGRTGTPNKDRVTIELTWGGNGLVNREGDDFAIFEIGSFEPFAVAVRKVGSTEFSVFRYQFPRQSDTTHNVNSVVFDLSSFGVADGEVIDAIRIRNVFNSQAEDGPDKVDSVTGEGRVLYPSDPEYVTGQRLLNKETRGEFRTEDLDADLIYAVALRETIKLKPDAPAAAPGVN